MNIEIEKERKRLRTDIVRKMKSIDTYNKSFDSVVDVYTDLLLQYKIASVEFAENGYRMTEEYTNKAGATNIRKTATYLALEGLRKDILSYSSQLGLNPRALDALDVKAEKVESKLDKLQADIASLL